MMIQYSTPSGLQTGTLQVTNAPGALQGVDLMPPSSGYAVLTIYDTNVGDTSALIIAQLQVDAGTVGLTHEYLSPVAVNKGIYCILEQTPSGSGSKYIIRYAAG